MMAECGECGTVVLVCDSPLACGICSRVFHQRCTDLKKPAAKLVVDYESISFECRKCLLTDNHAGQDMSVSDLKNEIESSISDSFADIQKNIDAQVNIALEKGIEKLIGSFNEVLRDKLVCMENSVAGKLEDLKSSIMESLKRDDKLAVMNRKRTIRDSSVHSQSDTRHRNKKHKGDKPISSDRMTDDSTSEDEVFDKKGNLSYAEMVKHRLKHREQMRRPGKF